MDFLKKMMTQTGGHLRGLNTSQRIAMALCALIIVVCVVWMVQWSGRRTYEPLVYRDLTEEELASVRAKLEEWRIDYRAEDGRIMVPPNTRHDLTARLLESETLPAGSTLGFAELISSESPWLSEAEKERRWTLALSNELASTLSRMAGVRKARVFIDNRQKRVFGGGSVQPSAVVSIWPRADFAFDAKRVHMLASFVSGAVAGLDIGRVRVIDESAGRSHTAHDAETNVAGDLMAVRRAEEGHYMRKITDRLSYIPGVLVQVFAEQETELTQVQNTVLDKPVISRTRTETTSEDRQSLPTGPGVRPNTGVAVTGAAPGEKRESETTEEEFEGERGREVTSRQNTKGVIKRLTASIGIPRSWLVGTYKRVKNQAGDPTEEQLQQFEASEFAKVIQAVGKIIDAKSDDQVAVSSFPDEMLAATGAGPASSEATALAGYVERYAAPAGLVVLALLSLGMMLRVVRKAPEGPPVPGHLLVSAGGHPQEVAAGPRRVLTETAEPLGDALSPDALLEGRELDEETARTQHLVSQMSNLIKQNPDRVAELVSRWAHQSGR